jgi:NADH-quinone oxidoreductase subunit C
MSDATTTSGAAPESAAPQPELLHGAPVLYSRGQKVVFCTKTDYVKVIKALKADGFTLCADLCGVDYLTTVTRSLPASIGAERFEVVVNLLSLAKKERIRVRVQVPGDTTTVASLFDLYPGTEAMEREAYDLLGISFDGHPDLSRILLPDGWEGHPLRKDYATGRIPVQFKSGPSGSIAAAHAGSQSR